MKKELFYKLFNSFSDKYEYSQNKNKVKPFPGLFVEIVNTGQVSERVKKSHYFSGVTL